MDYVTYIRSLVGNNKIIMNAAACIILNDNNEVLLQLRGDDHHWGLPGGIMELEETIEETATREVYEETGLTIVNPTILGTFYNTNKIWPNGDQAHVLCHVLVVKETTGTLHADGKESLDLQYFSFEKLPHIEATDHLQAITRYFRETHMM